MAAKKSGESKQGLVVVLVFFILATIGLGVATYYGFAEQEGLNAKVKEEAKKTKTIGEDAQLVSRPGPPVPCLHGLHPGYRSAGAGHHQGENGPRLTWHGPEG